jgi:hemolysin III
MDLIDELHLPPKWTQSFGEELANTISHTLGLVAALIGTPFLLFFAWEKNDPAFFIGTLVFVATILILYFGSALYHLWPQTPGKHLLQLIDHGAVFLLIAGTYTPFAVGPLRGTWGWTILVLVWATAIFGIAMKTARGVHRHTKLAMSLYLGMGWAMLIAIRPLMRHISSVTLIWLLAGGIIYTAGVFFFVNERVRYFHFIWHLFVLAGTSCHFLAVLSCAWNA